MKIGIFGGTFDPFTSAHLAIVDEVARSKLVDILVVSPTIVSWHRDGKDSWLSDDDKVKVISSIFDNAYIPDVSDDTRWIRSIFGRSWNHRSGLRVVLNNRDLLLKKMCGEDNGVVAQHRFLHTLCDVKSLFGIDNEYFVFIGTDSLKNFTNWSFYQTILANSKIVGIQGRDGEKVDVSFDFIPMTIKEEFSDMSASKMRSEYRNMENGVAQYIVDICKQKSYPEATSVCSKGNFATWQKGWLRFADEDANGSRYDTITHLSDTHRCIDEEMNAKETLHPAYYVGPEIKKLNNIDIRNDFIFYCLTSEGKWKYIETSDLSRFAPCITSDEEMKWAIVVG